MSSHLNSFQESVSADEDEDIEFAAFDPEPDESPTVGDDAAPSSAPNWFKPKTNEPNAEPEHIETSDEIEAPDFDFAPAVVASTATKKKTGPKRKSKVDKKQNPEAVSTRKRPSKSRPQKAKDENVVETIEEEPEELEWHEHAVRWLKSAAAGGYGISFIFHLILLIALSFVIYSTMEDNEPISMVMGETDGIPSDLEESAMLEMESSGGELNAMPEFKAVALEESQQSEMVDMASILGSGEGSGPSNDDGFTFSMPTGGRVAKKGSFAAWTVPKDPKPGQEYQIVIRIKLPKSSRKYRVDDLSGFVIGTDGFRLAIPFDRDKPDRTRAEKNGVLLPVEPRDYLRIVDSHVQLVVAVPGGASLVKDTIEVRSKKLKEEQKLEIEF